jgi:DNA-binding MarR family transcriptional regulator
MGPPAIAEQLRLARPTVSNLMKTMQRAHLINLTRDVDDARRVHVTATAAALELLRRYDGASAAILTAAMDELSADEQRAVAAAVPALAKLRSILAASGHRRPSRDT